MAGDDARVQSRRATLVTLAALGVPVLAILAVGVAFAIDAFALRNAAAALEDSAGAAQAAIDARDTAALAASLEDLQAAATDFTHATDGPHWWLATRLTYVKDQAIPLVTAGTALDAIARDALAPLTGGGEGGEGGDGVGTGADLAALDLPAPVDGRIDPLVLEPYREALARAAATMEEQRDSLAATDLTRTVDQVREPFETLRDKVDTLAGTVQAAHVTAELLPAMLGTDEPRTYLALVQNNAEPRATGGVPGAFVEVTAEDGRLARGRYVPSYQLIRPDGVAPLTDQELTIFTRRMSIYPQNVTFTPDFPRAAELAVAFWESEFGETPDGVLAIDPVALGWMLGDAPAATVDGIEVDGANVADVMLNRAYAEFPSPRQQDQFFADASAALFNRLTAGTGAVLDGAELAIERGRFRLYSTRPEEQALLATTPVAGDFLAATDTLGVFLNDGSGSKIGYYVDAATRVTDLRCGDGTLAGQTVELTLTHTYTGDVADLPDYVGKGGGFVPPGEFHANVLIYPAQGMGVTAVTGDGEPLTLHPAIHGERRMAALRVVLAPGESTTLTFDIEGEGPHRVDFAQTPGPRPLALERDDATVACG